MKLAMTTYQRQKQLEKSETYCSLMKCPICHSLRARKNYIKLQEKPDIYLLKCDKCKALSASRMPIRTVLEEYYSGYYIGTSEMVTFSNISRLAKHIIEHIDVNNKDTVNILDFGGGDGSLAILIADMLYTCKNKDVVLVDYKRTEVPHKIWKHHNRTFSHRKSLDDVEKKFDIILASGVLEHIPNLNYTIKKLFNMLKQDGYFYARTPYRAALCKMFPILEIPYPAHVHEMGASFWNRFIETFGLNAEMIISKPAIIETEFKDSPMTTILAKLVKFPAYIEMKLSKKKKDMTYNCYGSWEVMLRKHIEI